MKKLLPFIFLFLFIFGEENSFSQSVTSVGNGNWTNPSVWNCSCVPLPGYTIVINHNIILNTDFAYSSGSVTINASGSLMDDATGRNLWVSGSGSLMNHTVFDVKNFLYQGTGAAFDNKGKATFVAFMATTTSDNKGTITADSIYNTGTFTNDTTGILIADSATNSGIFTNRGNITFRKFTNTATFNNSNRLNFTDFTNTGTFSNADSIIVANSFLNSGVFNNNTGAIFQISKDFLNDDAAMHHAVFSNNGLLRVLNNWSNKDTVKGLSGIYIVSGVSYNSGWMKGTFDFCDLTPPATAPLIDVNTGTITPKITWCATGMNETEETSFFYLFPNPVQYELNIQTTVTLRNAILTIYNPLGQVVKSMSNINGRNIFIDSEALTNGFYFFRLTNDNKQINGKFIVEK